MRVFRSAIEQIMKTTENLKSALEEWRYSETSQDKAHTLRVLVDAIEEIIDNRVKAILASETYVD
jgi:hypothetical protein